MKNGRKSGNRPKTAAGMDDPEIAAALEGRTGGGGGPDPFDDFMQDFYADPDKPLKFLRNFMAGEDAYSPAVDVVEDKTRLTVVVDLPGVAEKDLQVEFVEGGVILRGRRDPAKEGPGARLRRAERPAGQFSKTVPLPRGLDVQAAQARLEHGVLTVEIPKGQDTGKDKQKDNGSRDESRALKAPGGT